MRSRKLARRYAIALGELAHESNVLDEVVSELNTVRQAMVDEPALLRALESENITLDVKKNLVREAFGDRVSDLTLNFLLLVVTKRRENALLDMIDEFNDFADEKKGVVQIELTTAAKLQDDQFEAISQRMSEVLGKQVRLTSQENPDLLGGVVARIGDLVMDGSVKARLGQLGEQLKRAQLN